MDENSAHSGDEMEVDENRELGSDEDHEDCLSSSESDTQDIPLPQSSPSSSRDDINSSFEQNDTSQFDNDLLEKYSTRVEDIPLPAETPPLVSSSQQVSLPDIPMPVESSHAGCSTAVPESPVHCVSPEDEDMASPVHGPDASPSHEELPDEDITQEREETPDIHQETDNREISQSPIDNKPDGSQSPEYDPHVDAPSQSPDCSNLNEQTSNSPEVLHDDRSQSPEYSNLTEPRGLSPEVQDIASCSPNHISQSDREDETAESSDMKDKSGSSLNAHEDSHCSPEVVDVSADREADSTSECTDKVVSTAADTTSEPEEPVLEAELEIEEKTELEQEEKMVESEEEEMLEQDHEMPEREEQDHEMPESDNEIPESEEQDYEMLLQEEQKQKSLEHKDQKREGEITEQLEHKDEVPGPEIVEKKEEKQESEVAQDAKTIESKEVEETPKEVTKIETADEVMEKKTKETAASDLKSEDTHKNSNIGLAMTCEDKSSDSDDEPVLTLDLSVEEEEEDFSGFENEMSAPYQLDFARLSFSKEELDASDISQLEDQWWKHPLFQRADSESSIESIDMPSSAASVTSVGSSASSFKSTSSRSRRVRRSTPITSISSPAFKKPFKLGFKREIVYRAISDKGPNTRRLADIYYYAPDGKKFRSNREIAEFLDESGYNLTTNNFTFLKEPLGIADPTVEIIREAKKKEISSPPVIKRKASPPQPELPLKVPKLKISTKSRIKAVNVKDLMPRTTEADISITKVPPLKISNISSRKGSPVVTREVKVTLTRTNFDVNQTYKEVESSASQSRPDGSSTKGYTPPCSIECANAAGLIPSLQCNVCVCLYHPVCVGLTQAYSENLHTYTCPNCRPEKLGKGITPPTLVPIPALTTAMTNVASTSLPRLQRLPKVSENNPVTLTPTMPMLQRFVTMPTPDLVTTNAGSKILYSLGSWRPPGVTSPLPTPTPASIIRPVVEPNAPQTLALMNGKKYIIIPRNNPINASGVSPDIGDVLDANSLPLQLLPTTTPPHTTVLPKGSLLVNQIPGPGTPGGMFLMTPAEGQEQPQFMMMPPSLVAATPSSSAMLPSTSEEAARQRIMPQRQRLPGGYTFTENLTAMYNALLGVFRYLTVQELLRAGRVCQVWGQVAQHHSLWRTMRMKNSRVKHWPGCIASIVRHQTTHLDLRKMLLPKLEEEAQAMWFDFCSAVQDMGTSLQRLDLCRCPASVVVSLSQTCPHLQLLTATAITVKSDVLDLKSISELKHLRGLRLKSFHGMSLENFQLLGKLNNLRQLSLTSVRMIPAREMASALSSLRKLQLLELGDCSGLLSQATLVAKSVSQLSQLQRLRLEKLVSDSSSEKDSVHQVLQAVASLSKLTHLELVNIEAGPECDQAMGKCSRLRKMLLVPSYISHGARTCQLMLRGVLQLKDLEQFTWVVTNEVIGVTRKLIKTKHSNSKVADTDECIPVLSPLPGVDHDKSLLKLDQLQIVSMSKLQSILSDGLPNTNVAVNKFAFQATWRQTLCDWDF